MYIYVYRMYVYMYVVEEFFVTPDCAPGTLLWDWLIRTCPQTMKHKLTVLALSRDT